MKLYEEYLKELDPKYDVNLATRNNKNVLNIAMAGTVGYNITKGMMTKDTNRIVGVSIGVGLIATLIHIYKKFVDVCSKSIRNINNPREKKIVYYKCQISACKKVISDLEKIKLKCKESKDQEVCIKKVNKQLHVWNIQLKEKKELLKKQNK